MEKWTLCELPKITILLKPRLLPKKHVCLCASKAINYMTSILYNQFLYVWNVSVSVGTVLEM